MCCLLELIEVVKKKVKIEACKFILHEDSLFMYMYTYVCKIYIYIFML